MPTFMNLVLQNGTAVDKTFSMKTNDNRISLWEDRSGGVPIGYPTVRLQTIDTKSVRKVKISIAVPSVEKGAVDGSGFTPAPRVPFVHRATVEFFLPMQGNTAQRTDILALALNALKDASITSVITSGDEITG